MNIDRLPGIRPRQSIWRRLDMAARRSFPGVTTALLLLLTSAPLGLPGQAELQAATALSCVFFWSLFRPASMPPVVVFMLGLLTDLLGYAPPGVGVLTLLLTYGLTQRWQRNLVQTGFVVIWVVFIMIATMAAALSWALTSLLTFHLLPPGAAVFEAGIAAGLYPLLSVIMAQAHQSLAEPEHA